MAITRSHHRRRRIGWNLLAVVGSISVLTLIAQGEAGGARERYLGLAGDAPVYGQVPTEDGEEPQLRSDEAALAMDAAHLAEDLGVTPDEALAYSERQPLIGEVRQYLAVNAGTTFSDVYIDYAPYRIVVLSLASGENEIDLISAEARFQELLPFIEVRYVDYTEAFLMTAMEQVGLLAGESGTQSSDADIRTGTVTVWVDSEESAANLETAIQKAEASGALLLPAASINILVGGGAVDEDSFAGNELNRQNGDPECTSGFSVEQTGGGTLEGVSTAGRCANMLELANGDDINFQAQRNRDNQDVQWHTTPGHTDRPWMRDSPTTVRNVTARKQRADMTIGEAVCKYGRTTEYTCGTIKSKTFDPDGSGTTYLATFIRVDDGSNNLSSPGDSGGPWFYGTTAYGIHQGSPRDDATDAHFMAQNYMGVLDIQVKIL